MALSEAEGLLRIAAADLQTAVASTDPTVFREGAWGFWLQQAVEKALKAWLLHLGDDDPPLTHACGDCSVYLQVAERTPLPGRTLAF
jgi:HEPN domain-containing protein